MQHTEYSIAIHKFILPVKQNRVINTHIPRLAQDRRGHGVRDECQSVVGSRSEKH